MHSGYQRYHFIFVLIPHKSTQYPVAVPSYRPTIRTGYVGLNVLDIEIPNMFQSKYLSTRTRPRKVPTATTYFPVVATPGGWDLGTLRPDLGSYHDSKTFGLF